MVTTHHAVAFAVLGVTWGGGLWGLWAYRRRRAGALVGHVLALAQTVLIAQVALGLPVSFLLWIVYTDYRKPIADVREIDLLADSELKLAGIVKSLLPPELGIWRIFCKQHRAWHRAPDFQVWVEKVPHHWRVIILALSPLTRLDSNALLDLEAAVRQLHGDGRKLVLAGVTQPQYRAVADAAVGQLIDADNLCPDLEFAIARMSYRRWSSRSWCRRCTGPTSSTPSPANQRHQLIIAGGARQRVRPTSGTVVRRTERGHPKPPRCTRRGSTPRTIGRSSCRGTRRVADGIEPGRRSRVDGLRGAGPRRGEDRSTRSEWRPSGARW